MPTAPAAPAAEWTTQRGGGGVNMDEYARRMASSRCDGHQITLQVIYDALKVRHSTPSGEGMYGVDIRGKCSRM